MAEILLILIITSISCGILGVFLVFRGLAMLTDAISHTVLLGIVLAFFVVGDLSSPFLIVAASASGLISCFLIERIAKIRKVSMDTSIGIVFPMFFSLAVMLISRYARNVHLDTDMVLMGELIMAPFERVVFLGYSLPRALVTMIFVLGIDIIYLILFTKKLSIVTFDEVYARTIGIAVGFLHYSFMTLVSMTAVAAFDTVGAILSISFFVAPCASAGLLTKRLKTTILLTCAYAIINVSIAYAIASMLNVSISGMCAGISGISFVSTFIVKKLLEKRQAKEAFVWLPGNAILHKRNKMVMKCIK